MYDYPTSRNHFGKGITVCERWLSFEAFFADMGPKPTPQHTIDRIDNTRGYSPDNCRWATHKEQANNKTNNRTVTYEGITQTLMAWAEQLGVDEARIRWRLNRGWPVEDALFRAKDDWLRRTRHTTSSKAVS
jgi:hypothetical protein